MKDKLQWGVVGTGGIAPPEARGFDSPLAISSPEVKMAKH